MSFNSHKPFKKRNSFPKYLIVFMLGISFALFFSSALNIVTWIGNATQYIKQIILTSDWTTSGTTGIVLDWENWRVGTTSICDSTLNNCKVISNLVTLWQSIFQSNWANIYYTWWNVGIWTDSPSQKLDVMWNISSSGTWSFDWNMVVVWNTSTNKLWLNQICDQDMTNCKLNNVWVHTNNSILIITWATNNFINWIYSTIWWWYYNKITSQYWFVWWWRYNEVVWNLSTVWWWDSNKINWQQSTIWWWVSNQIDTNEWFIWWWNNNKIFVWENWIIWWWELNQLRWSYSTIWWWYTNILNWIYSTIWWWNSNSIQWDYSAILWWRDNGINSDYSFAAWRNTTINHDYTFMRNWSSSSFSSAKSWTFLINSPNWVWINNNDPQADLDVFWDMKVSWTWEFGWALIVPALSSALWSSNSCSRAWSVKYEWLIGELCVCDGSLWKKVYSWSLVCIPSGWPDPD